MKSIWKWLRSLFGRIDHEVDDIMSVFVDARRKLHAALDHHTSETRRLQGEVAHHAVQSQRAVEAGNKLDELLGRDKASTEQVA